MLQILPRNFNKDVRLDRLITNPKSVEPNDNSAFTNDGVFSSEVFGNLSNMVSWSCNCGNPAIAAEFNKGVVCGKCETPVTYKGLSIEREGWIDLVLTHIHPLFYQRIAKKIIGKATLDKILHYKADIKVEGDLIEPEMEYPYAGIGMERFIANFEEILTDFANRKKTDCSNDYHFLMENVDAIFINYFPIINSKLRPAIVINGEFSFDAINMLYNGIIQNTNILKGLAEVERNPLNTLALSYKTQNLLNAVYENIVTSLSSKKGYIRNTLFG